MTSTPPPPLLPQPAHPDAVNLTEIAPRTGHTLPDPGTDHCWAARYTTLDVDVPTLLIRRPAPFAWDDGTPFLSWQPPHPAYDQTGAPWATVDSAGNWLGLTPDRPMTPYEDPADGEQLPDWRAAVNATLVPSPLSAGGRQRRDRDAAYLVGDVLRSLAPTGSSSVTAYTLTDATGSRVGWTYTEHSGVGRASSEYRASLPAEVWTGIVDTGSDDPADCVSEIANYLLRCFEALTIGFRSYSDLPACPIPDLAAALTFEADDSPLPEPSPPGAIVSPMDTSTDSNPTPWPDPDCGDHPTAAAPVDESDASDPWWEAGLLLVEAVPGSHVEFQWPPWRSPGDLDPAATASLSVPYDAWIAAGRPSSANVRMHQEPTR